MPPVQDHAVHQCPPTPPKIAQCVYIKGLDVPLAGALAVGARARVPDGFVRHIVWLSEEEAERSLLFGELAMLSFLGGI